MSAKHPRDVLYGSLALLRGLGLDDAEILTSIAHDRADALDLLTHWYMDEPGWTGEVPRAVHSVLDRHDNGTYGEIDPGEHPTTAAASWLARTLRDETPYAELREQAEADGIPEWALRRAATDRRGLLYGFVVSRPLPGRRGRPTAWSWGVDNEKIKRRDRRTREEHIQEWLGRPESPEQVEERLRKHKRRLEAVAQDARLRRREFVRRASERRRHVLARYPRQLPPVPGEAGRRSTLVEPLERRERDGLRALPTGPAPALIQRERPPNLLPGGSGRR